MPHAYNNSTVIREQKISPRRYIQQCFAKVDGLVAKVEFICEGHEEGTIGEFICRDDIPVTVPVQYQSL